MGGGGTGVLLVCRTEAHSEHRFPAPSKEGCRKPVLGVWDGGLEFREPVAERWTGRVLTVKGVLLVVCLNLYCGVSRCSVWAYTSASRGALFGRVLERLMVLCLGVY